MDAWHYVEALAGVVFAIVLYEWQREIAARKDQEERIKALEEYVSVRKARTELWKELGKPERRDDLPDTDFR